MGYKFPKSIHLTIYFNFFFCVLKKQQFGITLAEEKKLRKNVFP